jgi:WD40 repeat protein/alpha-L-arabinofuranosidase
VGLQVAEALAYAHKQGILHRDIKLSNLLLDTRGTVWITDFGLAKIEDSDDLTSPGDIVGTLRYMAPERFQGKADPRSDVYGLGTTLYELLTLRPAFTDSNRVRLIDKVTHEEPARPRKLQPHLPRDLETIVLKAIAKEPQARYQTADDLGIDLRRFLADRPILARRTPLHERTWRWCRRNPMVASLVGISCLLAMCLITGLVVINLLITREQQQTKAALDRESELLVERTQAYTQVKDTLKLEQRARYFRSIALAERDCAANQLVSAEQWLDDCKQPEQRGWEWRFLKRRCHIELANLRGHKDGVDTVCFSRDGRWLASGGGDKIVRIWDMNTMKTVQLLTGHKAGIRCVAFSPDGRFLASASIDQSVKVWSVADGKEQFTLNDHKGQVLGVAFSPDGRYLASGSLDKTLCLWDLQTRQPVRRFVGHTDSVTKIAFSQDGRWLLSGCCGLHKSGDWWGPGNDKTIRLWDVKSGKQLKEFKGHTGHIWCVAFSPDGKLVASASEDGTVRVWDVQSGLETRTLPGHARCVNSVVFSPDGTRLLSASWDATIRLWDVNTGRELYSLQAHKDGVICAVFSGDGKRIATASRDNGLKIWDSPTIDQGLILKGYADQYYTAAFSPDGRRLASIGGKLSEVLVCDAGTRQPVLTLKGHTNRVFDVTFSPDSGLLASASEDGTARIWDLSTGKPRFVLHREGRVHRVAFSPDGALLAAVGEDKAVALYDVRSGRLRREIKEHRRWVNGVRFSPDGKRLATASHDQTVRIWDVADGKQVLALPGQVGEIYTVAFSPDGKLLAFAGQKHQVRVCHAETGQEILTLHGHNKAVYNLAFSRDSQRLATASADETVKLWDTTTGQETLTLRGHGKQVYSVAFSPDGLQLVSAGGDRALRVWDARLTPGILYAADASILVEDLFSKLLLRSDVVERLGAETSINEHVRDIALRLAEEHQEDPEELNRASWSVVRLADGGQEAYRLALRRAEAASKLARDEPHLLNTLGVAQYRAGEFQNAAATMMRLLHLRTGRNQRFEPADLAFLSMARFRLDQKNEAHLIFGRLQAVMKDPTWARDPESEGFAHEAEQLIGPVQPGQSQEGFLNAGFEAGFNHWDVHGRSRLEPDAQVKRGSRPSLRISAPEPSDTGLWQEIWLQPGRWYRFSGWVRTRGLDPRGAPTFGTLQVQRPGGHGTIASGTNHGGDTDWTENVVPFQAPEDGLTRICVFFAGWGTGTGTAWFDDLKVEQREPPRVPLKVSRAFLHAGQISPFQYGQFVEYLCDHVGGMWAEKLYDGSFEGLSPYTFAFLGEPDFREKPWYPSGAVKRADFSRDPVNPVGGAVSQKIAVKDDRPESVGISQDGIAIEPGKPRIFTCYLRQQGLLEPVQVRLHRGDTVYASCEFRPGADWQKYRARLVPSAGDTNATLSIALRGPGTLWLDSASLMPEDAVQGWRPDLVAAVRALKPGIIRFGGLAVEDSDPGGFDWRDTIGDPDRRRPFRAWGGLQQTGPGLEEIVQFCRLVGAEPLLCVRFSNRTPKEAADQVEYFNGAANTPMGKLRARNGHAEPYGIKYWQVGNERGGPEYEDQLAAFCQAMKKTDPTIKLLSSFPSAGVLREAGHLLDYVCPHHYDIANLAATENDLAGIRALLRDHGAGRPIKVGVTEWNTTAGDEGPRRARLWTLENALACSRYQNLLHRHCDLVEIANRSNLTNSFCAGIIQTDNRRLFKTPTYYAQQLYATHAGNRPLKFEPAVPVNLGLDVSATLSARGDTVILCAVNMGVEDITWTVDFSAFGTQGQEIKVWTLADREQAGKPDATNSFDHPERVVPVASKFRAGSVRFNYRFPGLSLTVMEWQVKE